MGAARPVQAQDEAQALAEGVRLFQEGKYQAAQEVLVGVDSARLSPEQQRQHSDVLNQVNVALTMSEKAHRDLEDAGLAVDEDDHDTARTLLQRVIENEYASEAVRAQAAAMLENLGGGQAPEAAQEAHQQVDVERAATLTREGDEMRQAGRFDEARRLYNEALAFSPGFPEAVAGLRTLDEHAENVAGSRSLPDRIRQQDALNWQRTETEYRELKETIGRLVERHQFDEAKQLVLRARQVVEAGKQFAYPASDYENLRADLDRLEKYVLDAGRDYNEREIVRIRREIEENRRTRQQEAERNRKREVDSLMKQAMQHRKDGDFEAAIGVLEQVLIIDDRNDAARWLLEEWEDFWAYRQQRETRDEFYQQARQTLIGVERDKTPWADDLRYPKNWLEIISREERRLAGEGPLDSLLIGRLDTPIDLDLDAVPFREAVQRFAGAHGINVHVNWNDLVAAGVDPDRQITLTMPEQVTLKKAFDMVLAEAGGGVALGYAIGDGVMTVATRNWLDHSTQDVFTRIYDIQDLLHEVPDFDDAPTLDVIYNDEPTPKERDARPWQYGDDDDDEPESTPVDRSRIGRLIAMIKETVAPDTWRDRGGSIGAIHELNNQLVVTQNTAGQEQVANLLGQLRTQRAVQIAVEARFITVQSNYLEELGIDLDIVLNNGNAGFDMVSNANGVIATDPVLGTRLLLPRTFSQLGFLPNPAGLGTPFPGAVPVGPSQPFTQVGLVPEATGGAINMSNATPIPIRSGTMDLTSPQSLASGVPGSFVGRDTSGLTVFGSFLDNIQVDFLIRATEADSRTTLLTAPKLVLHNGQRAWVAVVTSHAFVSTLQPVVAGNAAAQQPTTQTVNEGAVLDVQGTVSADRRYVTLTLRPGVGRLLALERFQFAGANFISGGGFIQLPQVARQVLNTTVNVPDGGTLLIGGQKLAAEIEVEAGVPVLSRIPVLKRLYSSRTLVKDEQILLILVKPQILIQSEQERLAFPTLSRRDG